MTKKVQKPELTFVVLDFETTGFYPKDGHVILECAAIHVDFKTLEVLDTFQTVVGQTHGVRTLMDTFVTDMHTKNGLLEEVYAAADNPDHRVKNAEDLDLVLSEWLDKCAQYKNGPDPVTVAIQLCGNTIHFDRRYIEAYLPYVDSKLFYRMVDASSFVTAYEAWCGKMPEVDKAHRSMPDCEMSLKALRYMRKVMQHGDAQV